jgi:hypothetical protein
MVELRPDHFHSSASRGNAPKRAGENAESEAEHQQGGAFFVDCLRIISAGVRRVCIPSPFLPSLPSLRGYTHGSDIGYGMVTDTFRFILLSATFPSTLCEYPSYMAYMPPFGFQRLTGG